MARTLVFVPIVSGTGLIPLDEIPEDVRNDVEEAYSAMSNSQGRIRATFDDEDEANLFCRQAASYCAQREDGALKFRRSPTKGLPKNVVDFTIKRDTEANGERRSENADSSAKATEKTPEK